jgi:hypothetical protein
MTPINHILVLSQPEFVHPQVQEVLSRERLPFWKRKAK